MTNKCSQDARVRSGCSGCFGVLPVVRLAAALLPRVILFSLVSTGSTVSAFPVVFSGVCVLPLISGSPLLVGGCAGASSIVFFALAFHSGFPHALTVLCLSGFLLVLAGALRTGFLLKFISGALYSGWTAACALLGVLWSFALLSGALWPASATAALPFSAMNPGVFPAVVFCSIVVGIPVLRRLVPAIPGTAVLLCLALVLVPVETFLVSDSYGASPGLFGMAAADSLRRALSGFAGPFRFGAAHGVDGFSVFLLVLQSCALTVAIGIESFQGFSAAESFELSPGRPDRFLVSVGLSNLLSALAGGLPVTVASEYSAIIRRSATGGSTDVPKRRIAVSLTAVCSVLVLCTVPFAGAALSFGRISGCLLVCLASSECLSLADAGSLSTFRTIGTSDRMFWCAVFVAVLFVSPVYALPFCTAVWFAFLKLLGRSSSDYRLLQNAFRERNTHVRKTDSPQAGCSVPEPDSANLPVRLQLLAGKKGPVFVCEPEAPLFSGILEEIERSLVRSGGYPSILLIGMKHTLYLDPQGIRTVELLLHKCRKHGCTLLIAEIHTQPYMMLAEHNLDAAIGEDHFFGSLSEAWAFVQNRA